ncbi:MAG TPA: cytochrome P450 [Galbitalea sp.]|nr:cytochrome P450 [Galbitalea sp.]
MTLAPDTVATSAAKCPFPHELLAKGGTIPGMDPAFIEAMLAAHAAANETVETSVDSTLAPAAPVVPARTEGADGATLGEHPTDGISDPETLDGVPAPPADLTLSYDPLSYSSYDNPYDIYKRLRDEAPVYYNKERDLYVVSRYADVRAGLNDDARLVNAKGNDVDGTHDSYGKGFLVAEDPPRHTTLRQAIRRTFAAREILAKEDGVREFAQTLLAEMWAKGGGDFTSEFAVPMSVAMGISMVGAPEGDADFIIDHLWKVMERTVGHLGVPESAVVANVGSEELIGERIEARRLDIAAGADTSSNDAFTQILLFNEKGKVDDDEIVGLAHLVLSAASDAPAALMTNCIQMLDKFPKLQPYLRANPSMIKQFVEETLRFEAPAQDLARQTIEDVEIAGTVIPKDSRVLFLLGSANRDEREYENPEVFDLAREFTPKNRIMSFGEGIHACMGAPFARLAAKVMIEELLNGPGLRIEGTPERWIKQMIRGFSRLPIKFDA